MSIAELNCRADYATENICVKLTAAVTKLRN